MAKDKVLNLTRRDFLKISSTAGAGLLVSIYLSACQDAEILPTGTPSLTPTEPNLLSPTETAEPLPTAPPDFELQPNVYIKIDTDGMVTITVNKPEIGQGTRTSIPMIIAEELEVDWEKVQIVQAPADNDYVDQDVGGSQSISGMYLPMRRVGAAVRGLLIAAAAAIWEVDPENCYARSGVVYHEPTGNQLGYGELLTKASEIESSKGELKEIEDFRLIGSSFGRKDNTAIVGGSAEYASDLVLPDMLYAVVVRPPQQRNRLESYDDSATLAVPGVRYVVPIDDAVAVVAENTWQALKGREVLEVQWRDVGNAVTFSAPDDQHGVQNDGSTLTASYTIPHFSHSPMEPMTCVADVQENATIVWAPTQSPMEAKKAVRSVVSGTPSEEYIEVNIPLIGGGFGRRREVDYVKEAVEISQAVGVPIKVFWTRPDDIRNDYLHPSCTITVTAPLSSPEVPRLSRTDHRSLAKVGAWRAVESNDNAFARESFLDEYAEALGMDPVELRRQVYPQSQLVDVMDKAIAESNWGGDLPEGRALGLACFSTWNVTHVAEVVEVSIENGKIRVHKVVCAVDCGLVINPNMVKEQMEGGIVFALSAALGNEITIREGMIEQRNFDDYPLLRFDEMPEVEVHIIPSTRSPQGVGEMSGPPVFGAVANALYTLTGRRFRKLPFRL